MVFIKQKTFAQNFRLYLRSLTSRNSNQLAAFMVAGKEPCGVADVSNVDWVGNALQSAWPDILGTAPKLSTFLVDMLTNQRADRKSYPVSKDDTF
ncbi:hypothetical protein F4811DRAFT_544432 [Daldinia bambusicola]|nr:hypothetical protein F4811DRAFT_544432 [Daldinia bambusicola]